MDQVMDIVKLNEFNLLRKVVVKLNSGAKITIVKTRN